jgi:hypothetical protein
MKTISLTVSPSDYAAFQRAAEVKHRSVASLIREAMAVYRAEVLEERTPLEVLPLIVGHRQVAPLPSHDEIFDALFGAGEDEA